MQKILNKYNEKVELALDIVAFMTILHRTGYSNLFENKALFVEVLNEAGFRTPSGKEFTTMNYHNFMQRLPPYAKELLKEEYEKVFY